ncbi:MAG: hypothetical protein DSY77_09875 [Bacteroidetes bacterium]|nr:MAG: hypothetical protein DSY77_09875 [Bacteroidota bacterium]
MTNLSEEEFLETYEIVLKNITILNHSIVEKKYYKDAVDLCKDIDFDDIPFVAFSLYLKCNLWTGDKKLINGLRQKGYKKLISTNVLFTDFLKRNGGKK